MAWFEALNLTSSVTLVAHDWGSALGFHRAACYPEQIKAIAYMEAIALPRRWEDFCEAAGIFRELRSERGEQMILNGNSSVEAILPRSMFRKLSEQEMDAYRAPFLMAEDRLPTLVWPRQIPIEGEPADVTAIVENYGSMMSRSANCRVRCVRCILPAHGRHRINNETSKLFVAGKADPAGP